MLISVIIPAYNVENFIARSIDSVLNQSYKNIELVIVDDGSLDSTGQICDEYCSKDNRVKVIHQKNLGVSTARNVGLDNCSGDYICFLDSDDYFDLQYFENILPYLESKKYSLICNPLYYSNVKGYFFPMFYVNEQFTFSREEALKELFKCKLITGGGVAAFYRCEDIKNIRYNKDIKVFEDILFKYNFIKNCTKQVLYYPYIGYYYDNTNQSSATNSYSIIKKLDAFKVMEMIMEKEQSCADIIKYKMYIPTKVDYALLEDTYEDLKDKEICHKFKQEVLKSSLKLLFNPKLDGIYKRIIILLFLPKKVRMTYLHFRRKIHIKKLIAKLKFW